MSTVINFFLSNFSIAQELSINYPNMVKLNDEFKVSFTLDSQENYDVKIFVHNSPDSGVTRDEYISQIFNNEKNSWQSSWNYLPSSYPNQLDYKLKILNSPGDGQICVRVRKTGQDKSISECNPIKVEGVENTEENNEIMENKNNEEENDNDYALEDSNSEKNGPVVDNLEKFNEFNNLNQEKIELAEMPYNEEDNTIELNSINKDKIRIKELENEIYTTKKQKTLLSIFYIFNLFLAFILILIIFKKI